MSAVAPRTEIDREIRQLESDLKQLEAEYNLFFGGRLPRPPWETRARVEALVRRLDRSPIQNTAERFRFQTLQARFAAFCELWERSLRAREEGRPLPGRVRAPGGPGATPPGPAAAPAEAAGSAAAAVHVTRLRDPGVDAQRVRELYDRITAARRSTGEREVPFERFEEIVRHQIQKVGRGGEVVFQVAVRDGKVRLSAKPAERKAE